MIFEMDFQLSSTVVRSVVHGEDSTLGHLAVLIVEIYQRQLSVGIPLRITLDDRPKLSKTFINIRYCPIGIDVVDRDHVAVSKTEISTGWTLSPGVAPILESHSV